jgi:hypothetical protein
VDQFNHKKVLGEWIFDFLLTCIQHDDIVHKSDATGYIICISLFFFVSTHTPCRHINFVLIDISVTSLPCPPILTDAPEQGQPI